MKILLINPPSRASNCIPLGLGYIASVLRQAGHSIEMLDINGSGCSAKDAEGLIKSLNYGLAGISGLTTTYKYVKWIAAVIRQHRPDVPIIAGNKVATDHPEILLRNSDVDIAVMNEGEETVVQLVDAIEKGLRLNKIKGIYYKDGRDIIRTAERERLSDLDSLPFPAWDLFPVENYFCNSTSSTRTFGRRCINISTARGCPYSCTFCSHSFGTRVFMRSAASIIEEIKQLKKMYKIGMAYFCDDLFLVNRERALEFCDRAIHGRLGVKWITTGRVNLANAGLLKKMRQAGCTELSYGFESGSQFILDSLKKCVTVAQAEEAIKMTRAANINVVGSFIFGMPGETLDSIKETLGFIRRTRLPIYRFFYATPYPNTELYEIAKKMGRLPEDEDKYLESLGEMRETFLVNLTDFSDDELVRLKNWAEETARGNLDFGLTVREFVNNWRRRYFVTRASIKRQGLIPTVKTIWKRQENFLRIRRFI